MTNPPNSDRPSRRSGLFQYNPEVNAGHVMTGILMVGVLVTGYLWFKVDMTSQINAVRVDMAAHEARLTTAEHAIVADRKEQREFTTEMRAYVAEIQKSLNALQLQLVERGKAAR